MVNAVSMEKAYLRFLSEKFRLGEQKINLLIDYPGRKLYTPIFDIVRVEGDVL